MNTIQSITLFLTLTAAQTVFGQTNEELALSKGRKAIELMDAGNFAESIKLLEEAQELDPEMFDYPYEIAYANYLNKNYKETVRIAEKLITHKDVSDRLFQLLGNTYDMLGKSDKALEVYDKGLEKFPNSGLIYLEKGNVYWEKKEYEKALPYYEIGIEANPEFPSNYYRAARIYLASSEDVWGMIYGEIFMNLERNTQRAAEISKLLYETYKREIKFTSDTSVSVSFCQQMMINADVFSDPRNRKLPFCMIYEPTLLLAVTEQKMIDLTTLHQIRTHFVESYFKAGHNKTHPNILFDYQDKVLKAGHMEAYNHWILMKGDEERFDKWHSENKEKWDSFIAWFGKNSLKPDSENRFYKAQY